MRTNTIDDYWRNVDRRGPNECWPWTGATIKHSGHGQFTMANEKWTAHRLAWTIAFGPIPIGMHALHHCDNPICQNPAHLFLGTHAANVADMIAKGRQNNQRKTHCPKGHPYDEANTRLKPRPGGRFQRACRACDR